MQLYYYLSHVMPSNLNVLFNAVYTYRYYTLNLVQWYGYQNKEIEYNILFIAFLEHLNTMTAIVNLRVNIKLSNLLNNLRNSIKYYVFI